MSAEKLVTYFSATGTTKKVAEMIAEAEGADIFEIVPVEPYTAADLDWTNKQSRSTVEMQNLSCRPAMKADVENFDQYKMIFVGFPLWWNREPSIIDTFLDAHDFEGKIVIPFLTSGGGGGAYLADRFNELLHRKAIVTGCKRLGGDVSFSDLKTWMDGLDNVN